MSKKPDEVHTGQTYSMHQDSTNTISEECLVRNRNEKPYILAEVANVHGGELTYLRDLVRRVRKIDRVDGIKFQPFKYDKLALPDYSWYETYKKLYIEPRDWAQIIILASKNLDVWIDTFDEYSCEIIQANIERVKGIKLQASILYNDIVFRMLSGMNLSKKWLSLNISGLEKNKIHEIVAKFENGLCPARLLLQVGFQSYPTLVRDSGIMKIDELKTEFPYSISFADHADAESDDAFVLPIVAISMGAFQIEKHICLQDRKPNYDFQSSLGEKRFEELTHKIDSYFSALSAPFINDAERNYLQKTRQVPISNKKLSQGVTINISKDLNFKRTGLGGLNAEELSQERSQFCVIGCPVEPGQPLKEENLKKATVAAVIACRLKSTRLHKKALLKIGELTSVELCIKNTLRLRNVNHVILATSHLREDAELANYTFDPSVIFHKGDPDDVIRRYLTILDQLRVDVLVRITADMPYVSREICNILLHSHFEYGADFTYAKEAAVGTACEIINVQALTKVKEFFGKANYSEYMSFYFKNNPKHFRLNEVELPEDLIRPYRLTLDYEEDLNMLGMIENHLCKNHLPPDLANIFYHLDSSPETANMNIHLNLSYKTDADLIRILNANTIIGGQEL
jgi:N,N'-diacetyllegionaminate synthase